MPSQRSTPVAAIFALLLAAHPAASQQMQTREQTADQQVMHALSRLTFGPRPGEAAHVRAIGVDNWMEQQLAPAGISDTGMARVLAAYPALDTELGEMRQLYRQQVMARRRDDRSGAMTPTRQLNAAINDVAAARLARAVASERQLAEVMADFWANHFSVARSKGQTRLYLNHYDAQVIRPHAMGRFRDLLGAVAKSPAMLFYLDNARSVAERGQNYARRGATRPTRGAPDTTQPPRQPRGLNENYARELLELHTLGVDGGYTQQDVMETARALTGWTIDPASGEFTFRGAAHDRNAKRVLGISLPAGRGIADGEAVLDLVARHPATARHIARKLVVRFVSDSPPPALVERAAATFARTDGDITETLRTIITSDEFFARDAWRAKVKTPFELVASTYRALGQVPDATPRGAQLVARLGQPIYGRQTPDGWPDTADEWMNAGSILSRINFGLLVAGGRVPGLQLARWDAFATMRDADAEMRPGTRDAEMRPGTRDAGMQPGTRDAVSEGAVDIVVAELLGGTVSVETREILGSGTNPLLARTPAPSDSVSATARGLRLSPLQQLVGLALGAPEFQRR